MKTSDPFVRNMRKQCNHGFDMPPQPTTTRRDLAPLEPWAYTRGDAARLLSLSVRTIDNLIKRGELSAIRVTAKAVRIPADSIREFLDRRRCLRPGV